MMNNGKVKAVFLCESPENVEMVFGAERIEMLSKFADLPAKIFSSKDFGTPELNSAEVIFSTWGMPVIPPEVLDSMKNLRCVCYAAGATDHFVRPLLAKGVHVVSAWKANALPVAEFTIAQILLGLKNYFVLSAAYKTPSGYNRDLAGCGAYGATVALIGDGAIATRVKELLANFNLEVIMVASRPEQRTVSLEEAFSRAQVVSNHLPDRSDNIGILHGGLFSLMKPNAVFINTGRGRQVNEDEMIAVLEKRTDITALLDVTYPEPPEAGSRLYSLENVILTPHIAGSLNDETHRMADFAIEDFKRYINGEPLQYEVFENMLITSAK